MVSPLERVGRWLARYLSRPRQNDAKAATSKPWMLSSSLKKGDVLLVEGSSRFGLVVKYLTQSTWSHAALFIGDALGPPEDGQEACVLVEADVNAGVRAVPLSMYSSQHTRICRPVGLSPDEIDAVATYMITRLGDQYDHKHVIDLARYLIQRPPVPPRWRRQFLAFGSGDPTQAICSSLIAQAFQAVHYPILPDVVLEKSKDPTCVKCYKEILHIRHHQLFTPRDFDVSPYFLIIKPTIGPEFDPHRLNWDETTEAEES